MQISGGYGFGESQHRYKFSSDGLERIYNNGDYDLGFIQFDCGICKRDKTLEFGVSLRFAYCSALCIN